MRFVIKIKGDINLLEPLGGTPYSLNLRLRNIILIGLLHCSVIRLVYIFEEKGDNGPPFTTILF